MTSTIDHPRVKARNNDTNAYAGKVIWSWRKSIGTMLVYAISIVGGYLFFSWHALIVFVLFTMITLLFGHSLGMHRLFIHRSYQCPRLLEYFFVHLGVLVGLAGPLKMMQTHDLRDWAQQQSRCHDYFSHRQSFFKDYWWQTHCDLVLEHPPVFTGMQSMSNDKVYHFMQKTWIWQQLPWLILFAFLGGLPWVVWGVFVRISVSITGHWLIGYFAHNRGHTSWLVNGAAAQGYNIKYCGLLTMGECWHNNHHAFPESVKLGINKGQSDPGWWMICALERLKLVWDIKLPDIHSTSKPLTTVAGRKH